MGVSVLIPVFVIVIHLYYRTANNIIPRIILELPNTTHNRFLDQLSGLNHIHHILKYRFIKCMQFLSNSNNNKLVHLYNICHKNKQSPSGLNIARITYEYNVKSCDFQQCNMLTQMKIFLWKGHRILVMIIGKSIL